MCQTLHGEEIVMQDNSKTTSNEGYGQTYKIEWVCDNCYEKFFKHIAMGHRKPSEVKCPNCGCLTDGRIFR